MLIIQNLQSGKKNLKDYNRYNNVSLFVWQIIDHFLECHMATDFGIVSRAMRFDNVLAALMETGQLTFRYYVHHYICHPETGLIITTYMDERTTTIRIAGE